MRRAVIFDIDGVLVDSYEAHFESWAQIAREHQVAFTREDFQRTFGRTSRAIIQMMWPDGESLDAEAIREIDDRKEALYRDIVAERFPAMPGASALIEALVREGFGLAAGSSGPPENVRLCLRELGCRDAFEVVVTGEDVTHGKPDPEVFLRAATRLAIEPSHIVVIEDAPAGIDAARRGGFASIGLASTGRSRDELSNADLVVDSLDALSPMTIAEVIERHGVVR